MAKRARTVTQRSPSQSKCTTTISIIPDELLENILARLPVKSLARFKSVCRAWREMISDPRFARAHLRRSKEKTPLVLMLPSGSSPRSKISLYHYQDSSLAADLLFERDLPEPARLISAPLHCDGLVLLATSAQLYVCNPSTKELKTLPAGVGGGCLHQIDGPDNLGFGLDPCTGKYKVVRFFYRSHSQEDRPRSMGMEVLTLGASTWRVAEEDAPYPIMPGDPSVFFNGAVYWRMCTKFQMKYPKHLVCFDLRDEKCRAVPAPPSCSSIDAGVLTERKGHLCFLCCGSSFGSLAIWTTKDGTTNPTWTPASNIGRPTWTLSCFSSRGECSGRISLRLHRKRYCHQRTAPGDYELKATADKGTDDVSHCNNAAAGHGFEVITSYVESLVSINHK